MSYAILICDDDPDTRGAMKRTLRDHDITEVGSPRDALAMMKTKAFAAVISDFTLEADTDGLDLLQHVRIQYPDTVRILVTGNRDMQVAARAVNEGAVDRYFSKPWDDDNLRDALEILLRSRQRSAS